MTRTSGPGTAPEWRPESHPSTLPCLQVESRRGLKLESRRGLPWLRVSPECTHSGCSRTRLRLFTMPMDASQARAACSPLSKACRTDSNRPGGVCGPYPRTARVLRRTIADTDTAAQLISPGLAGKSEIEGGRRAYCNFEAGLLEISSDGQGIRVAGIGLQQYAATHNALPTAGISSSS